MRYFDIDKIDEAFSKLVHSGGSDAKSLNFLNSKWSEIIEDLILLNRFKEEAGNNRDIKDYFKKFSADYRNSSRGFW